MNPDEPQQESQPQYPAPLAPPTQPGPLLAVPPQSKWPTVLGVISIVFGAIGILGGVCGLGSAFMPNPWTTPSSRLGLSQIVLFILNGAVSVGLLVLGISLLQRRPWARWFALTWAVVEVIESVVTVPIGMYQAKGEMEAQVAAGAPPPPAGFGEGFFWGGTVCGVLFSLALPVFFLVWFSRDRIKREVAGWRGAGISAEQGARRG